MTNMFDGAGTVAATARAEVYIAPTVLIRKQTSLLSRYCLLGTEASTYAYEAQLPADCVFRRIYCNKARQAQTWWPPSTVTCGLRRAVRLRSTSRPPQGEDHHVKRGSPVHSRLYDMTGLVCTGPDCTLNVSSAGTGQLCKAYLRR